MSEVSLKEHLESLIGESDRRYSQRFDAQEKAVREALLAAERAVQVAEANAEKWRMNSNEWRGAMNDRERNLMPRIEAERAIAANSEKIDALATRLDRTEGRSGGLHSGWLWILGGVGLISTVINIFMMLSK